MKIQTSIQSIEQPAPVLQDSNGIIIASGDKVAYNCQGSVIFGTIKELKRSEWVCGRPGIEMKSWWYLKFELLIENEEGHISKIENPNSFIIL